MRRRHLIPAVLLIGLGAACAPGGVEASTPAPVSLPTPPDGTTEPTPRTGGGGLASQLTPRATPEYLHQVAAATKLIATGRVKMVAAAVGGRGREGKTSELSVLEGRWDNGAGRSRLRLDPTGAVDAGDTGISALLGGPVEMIQIGTVQYLQMGASGTGWTKTEGGAASAIRPIFDLFKVTDVSGFLGALACAAPVQDAGEEAVDGVSTNHYVVEAASAKLEECISRDPNAGGLLNNLGDSERAKVDVWVDEGSLVRRLIVTADEKALGGVAPKFPGATSVMTMTLSGFGEPAGIEPPPADQVTDGSGLGGLLGSGDGDTTGLDLSDILSGLG